MKALILVFGVWPAFMAASFGGLLMTGREDADLHGEIILEQRPFCESFVVQADQGFSLLDWDDGLLVFAKGDRVAGPLRSRGLQRIDVIGYGEMKVRVVGWSPDLDSVRNDFRDRCMRSGDIR
jgi:hypothetical protein